ncbi:MULTISPECIES: 50S ribosomal protein L25/general stress protein Ctc [unclassified Paenibacillus]|uniref:50S ribosomal protein L25/general stress protein Ctc n=1 Tax=unclassified Paenibacillus TaxID=185978 RepID=UPI00095414AA|nr:MULTISPECIES: 50S ribosomal protein L25/general stress protein Ctc [unclassified Paenibacillus]ASS67679.1 50S ribosomal protein L25/general stress protein Ctc [Paenibacillus sp. RUD330]SIR66439.1 large subunit ribosomal protein L25 [Paenibacillus sp. RU4X]SIR74330.1 large subunit ribosomal protein L25 [Paenibacillus sp. RU4T]
MAITMQAQTRTNASKGSLRQLRKEGKVPAVVYGKKLESSSVISLDEKEIMHLLRSHPNAIIELSIPDAGKQPVMITDVQRDALSRKVVHIDLHQINMNEEIKTAVRIDLAGDSAGVREGGVLSVSLHELEIQCLPNDIPESIEADISSLGVGENLLVGDLKLPGNVTVLSDAEQVVVAVLAPQKEVSEEEADEAAKEDEKAAARSEDANAVDEE